MIIQDAAGNCKPFLRGNHARLINPETKRAKTVLFLKEKNQKNFGAKLRFAYFSAETVLKNRSTSKTASKRNEVSRQNSFSLPFSFKKKEEKKGKRRKEKEEKRTEVL